tara:strand:- start:13864 stop:14985 length:1122 start_codon:yes stop_codon:yes gene_type:complete
MIELQVARLAKKYPASFTPEEAAKTVARAYGYERQDSATGELVDPVPGLQLVRPYSEILVSDRTHQVMDFMRMAMNLSIPNVVDYRNGIPERDIICAMLNFNNFDAILSYARGDTLDPNTHNRDMLQKFHVRYGYYAPIQYLLGLYIQEHTLIIQPDPELAQRIVDQEVTLNPLDNMRVVILRTDPAGDAWLQLMSRSVASYSGNIEPQYGDAALKALGQKPVLVSKIAERRYSLLELVRSHIEVLNVDRSALTLIIDRLDLALEPAELDEAFTLASTQGIHLVVIVKRPVAELWSRTGIHLIFGYPDNVVESNLEMDKYLAYGAPYVGFKNGKMQYLYVSAESGPRFGAMDFIPDDPKVKTLLERIKQTIIG